MALLENAQNFFRDILSVIAAKNADYAKPEATGDEYFNFVATAFIHRTSPQQVIAQEITKKAIRLANLADGSSPATGEAVADTLRDIVGYAAIYQSFEIDDASRRTESNENPTSNEINNARFQSLPSEVKSALLGLFKK